MQTVGLILMASGLALFGISAVIFVVKTLRALALERPRAIQRDVLRRFPRLAMLTFAGSALFLIGALIIGASD